MFSALLAFGSLLAVQAAPVRVRRAPAASPPAQCMAAGATDALGAVYFLSNAPRMNHVVSSLIAPDGKLSLASRHATGGAGGTGAVDPPAEHHADALFSQHAVITAGDSMVVAVNPGSNTISMFAIDEADPSKLTLMAVEPSGGEFPVALAATKDGKTVCALNSAGKGAVRCFAADAALGLTPMGGDVTDLGVNQTNPPKGPLGTVSDMLFDNAGNLVVAVKGQSPDAPGHLALFATKKVGANVAIADPNAKPTLLAAKDGVAPFGMSAALDGSPTLFVTDAGFGVSTFTTKGEVMGNVAAVGGEAATSTSTKIDGQVATCWSAQSKVTNSFFSTDIGTSQITEFSVANGQSKQIAKYQLQGNTTDIVVASTKNGDFLYSLLPGAKSIGALSVGNKAGGAKIIQTLEFGKDIPKLTEDIQGIAALSRK